MGVVYAAEELDTGRHVALKVIRPELLGSDEIRERHRDVPWIEDVEWIDNPDADSPMMRSLKLALARLAGDSPQGFFFLPVDLPLIRTATYTSLIQAFSREPGSRDTFLPVHQGRRGHPPLCSSTRIPGFLDVPEEATPRDVIASGKVLEVPVDDPGIHRDMDTPEDYNRRLEDLADR